MPRSWTVYSMALTILIVFVLFFVVWHVDGWTINTMSFIANKVVFSTISINTGRTI